MCAAQPTQVTGYKMQFIKDQAPFRYSDIDSTICSQLVAIDSSDSVGTIMRLTRPNETGLGYLSDFVNEEGTVLIQTDGACLRLNDTTTYAVLGAISRARAIHKRCTAVFEVSDSTGQRYTIKFSWQVVTRIDEAKLVPLAGEHGIEHVAKVAYSQDIRKSLEGHRSRLPPDTRATVPLENQCPHVLVRPISKPLYEVENPEHFLKASLSLLEAIHNLYVRGKIMHGNVSVNNMMVRAERPWEGILLDLDLARDEQTSRQGLTSLHRTGTLPFMALDLLHDQNDYPHYHRHDLESLVYVLVWITGNCEDGSMVQPPLFNEWCEGDWSTVRLNKTGFLLFDMDYWHFSPNPPYEFLGNLLLQLRMILGQAHISARFEFHSTNIRPPNDPPPIDEGYVESSSGQRRNRQTSADKNMPRAVLQLPEDLPGFDYDILRSKLKATLENLGSPV